MTDKTDPAVTDDDRRLAREWAESIESATNSVESTTNPWSDRALAAARVILDAIPDPPRPTLADMTPKDRAACQWMQADVKGEDSRVVIVNPYWLNGCARVMCPATRMRAVPWEIVTPRPDLPRMEWPGDTPNTGPTITFTTSAPAPALPEGWLLADHRTRGRVIVTRPEPDADGDVVIVCPEPDMSTRAGMVWCKRDRLTYIDTEPEEA